MTTQNELSTRAGKATVRVLLAAVVNAGICFPVLANDPPASADSAAAVPRTLPQEGFFSSVKQSMRQGFDHEVVRGHFDLDASPKPRRYYCLIDTKTGFNEPNGVLGEPTPLSDGSTGLKIDAVSLYSCATAEKQGMLVTSGYHLSGWAAAANRPSPTAPPAAAVVAPTATVAPPLPIATPIAPVVDAARLDVAGVKLGMTLEEVRSALKAKHLQEYHESPETLSYWSAAKSAVEPVPSGRFINVIAAWTPPPATATDAQASDGESYEVMFTPNPGSERAMAIVHTVGYSPANAVRESALENGLTKKYGALPGAGGLPQSPTWRYQAGGALLGGDACGRRGLFGGLGSLAPLKPARENIALKKPADELQNEVERCGEALVTEDHVTAGTGTLPEDRMVTRYTVTAYAPPIAVAGGTAARRLIQAARGTGEPARARDAAPSL